MKSWSSRKKKNSQEVDSPDVDKVEARFQTVVDLVRDLDEEEINRLIKGVKLCWQGYREVEQARPAEEKEDDVIFDAEKILEKESGRNK